MLAGSLREMLTSNWKELGLGYEPTVGDNCVHASASPFEGLAERMNWLKVEPKDVSCVFVMFLFGVSFCGGFVPNCLTLFSLPLL